MEDMEHLDAADSAPKEAAFGIQHCMEVLEWAKGHPEQARPLVQDAHYPYPVGRKASMTPLDRVRVDTAIGLAEKFIKGEDNSKQGL